MRNQASGLSGGSEVFIKKVASRSRAETYETVDLESLQEGDNALVGKKVILSGTLFLLENDEGINYLEVEIPHGYPDSVKTDTVRVAYRGEVSGLVKGIELRIWGTYAGMCTKVSSSCCGILSFPFVRADILQW